MSEGYLSQKAVRYARELRFVDLPIAVVEKAKACILDQIGVQLACSTLPWSRAVYEYVRSNAAGGPSTVLNYGLKTTEENAAFVNGSFGQGFEVDDQLLDGPTGHVGCTVVPVAMAIGEKKAIDGKEIITATVVGYEVMSALARGVQPTMLVERGFHPNSALGPLAAATVAGRLLGLDEVQMINAMGIAGSFSSGLMEYTRSGGDVKRIYGALGASGGVRAALLAEKGLTGPPTVLEGDKGFCQAFSNAPDPEGIDKALQNQEYRILHNAFKMQCSNGNILPAFDAVSDILAKNRLSHHNVAEIQVGLSRIGMLAVAKVGPRPRSVLEAQFSIEFGVALTMVYGRNDFETYVQVDLQDPSLLRLANKVKPYLDGQCDKEHLMGKMPCRVSIKMQDGTTHESYAYARGTDENPQTQDELEAKFTKLSTMVLSPERTEEIRRMVRGLEQLEGIRELTRLLTAAQSA